MRSRVARTFRQTSLALSRRRYSACSTQLLARLEDDHAADFRTGFIAESPQQTPAHPRLLRRLVRAARAPAGTLQRARVLRGGQRGRARRAVLLHPGAHGRAARSASRRSAGEPAHARAPRLNPRGPAVRVRKVRVLDVARPCDVRDRELHAAGSRRCLTPRSSRCSPTRGRMPSGSWSASCSVWPIPSPARIATTAFGSSESSTCRSW